MTGRLLIQNDGPDIRATNYFDSEYARRGVFYLSVNAGAFRLLVPRAQESAVTEFHSAKEVIISRGPWQAQRRQDGIEILFDDHTDEPYAIHISAEQVDRLLPASESGREADFSAWVQSEDGPSCVYRSRCHYRVVPTIPYLKPLGQ